MFVRFRKSKSGGAMPEGAAAKIQCQGRCIYRGYVCPVRPRCRWRIGWDESHAVALEPYRLNVSLVENRRIDGKVKQEHVAHLGAIDGYLLEAFFEGLNPETIARIKADDWELRSLRARVAFWKDANERLRRLENRLGPDLKRLRIAIHKRVPWPMEEERNRLAVFEAEIDLRRAEWGFENSRQMFKANERIIKRANEQNAELGRASVQEAKFVQEARDRLTKMREKSRSEPGV